MKVNKIFKWMLIIVSIMTIISCSYKNNNHHPNNEAVINTNSDIDSHKNFALSSSEENMFLQIQHLKKKNIVYFDLNKYYIHDHFMKILDDHARFLLKNPSYNIIIEGHADERGSSEYNIALGERRANSVKNYLQSKGVLSKQMNIVSFGKEKPAVFGHNEEAYSKNRRAVLVY